MQALTRDFSKKEFWQSFASDLHICNTDLFNDVPLFVLSDKDKANLLERLRIEGYFQASGVWRVDCKKLAQLVRRLSEANYPTPFAFIYDEFWIPFIQLHNIFKVILGDKYFVLPDFWVWNVDPKKNEEGWKPHRDKNRFSLLPDGMPKTLTVWIPLSEATPLNGCMYIVPAMLDPTYNTEKEQLREFEYSSIRALPAKPGDFFAWNQAVFHWGGKSSPLGHESRVSMAFEFQRADVQPFNQPLINPLSVLNYEMRLKLVAKQMLQYKHMYSLSNEMALFATNTLQN